MAASIHNYVFPPTFETNWLIAGIATFTTDLCDRMVCCGHTYVLQLTFETAWLLGGIAVLQLTFETVWLVVDIAAFYH